jgi:hypothetical protein
MNTRTEFGLLAQFADADALLLATRRVRAAGYTHVEAYAPYAVDGLPEAVGPMRDHVAAFTLVGGLLGGIGTLALQYYAAVIDYPQNVGGRPDASWPAFIPAALEMTILFAVLAGILGMLVGNRLPRLHHPLFALERFEAASRDGFFLLLRADDPRYEAERVLHDFSALDPTHVETVPR